MTEWENLEYHLRASLRRVTAPEQLEARILRAVHMRRLRRRRFWFRAAAALLLVVSTLAYGIHRREQLRAKQAEQARQQLELAIQVANRRLAQLEQQLSSIGVRRIRLQEVSQ